MSDEQKTVLLKNVRLCYPKLAKPEEAEHSGEKKWGATLVLDTKTPDQKKQAKALLDAIKHTREDDLKGVKAKHGLGEIDNTEHEKADIPGFEVGAYFINAASYKRPPIFRDEQVQASDPSDDSRWYPGARVNAQVTFWGQDSPKWGKRVNCTLQGLQFCGHDVYVGGAAEMDDSVFGAVEVTGTSPFEVEKGAEEADDDGFDGLDLD